MAQLVFVSPGTLEWAIHQVKMGLQVTRKSCPALKFKREMLDKPGMMVAFGKDSVMAKDWIIDEDAKKDAKETSEIASLSGSKAVFDDKNFGTVGTKDEKETAVAAQR